MEFMQSPSFFERVISPCISPCICGFNVNVSEEALKNRSIFGFHVNVVSPTQSNQTANQMSQPLTVNAGGDVKIDVKITNANIVNSPVTPTVDSRNKELTIARPLHRSIGKTTTLSGIRTLVAGFQFLDLMLESQKFVTAFLGVLMIISATKH